MSALCRHAVLTVLILAGCGGLALAITPPSAPPDPDPVAGEEQVAPDAESAAADAQAAANEELIRRMQSDSEAVIAGKHFTYEPGGRRDPFEPLIKSEPERTGKRPKGIAGMTVAEIALKGLAIDPRGAPAALFQGSDNRGYTLRVGDIVYDARVISIDTHRGVVVFRQQVDDPRRIKPYRDVLKRLNPADEDKDVAQDDEEGA
ncbi:MAG: hypothetical protein KBD01_05460 [Acidobacteria bacterium]|nr:hypothetical protein [Acidobacteriota bacterium]